MPYKSVTKQKEYMKRYYQRNKEKQKEYYKRYHKENNTCWFKKTQFCKLHNKITTPVARIMAYKATYTECQHCGSDKNLCVDHDHDTGELRGILCQKCNFNDVLASNK